MKKSGIILMQFVTMCLSVIIMCLSLTGCLSEAERINQEISENADSFNIMREITVVNTRTDTVLFNVSGIMSISNNGHNELVLTIKENDETYSKHYIYLSADTAYVVEDITHSDRNKIIVLPKMQEMGQEIIEAEQDRREEQ